MKKYRITDKHPGLNKGCIIIEIAEYPSKCEILKGPDFIGNINLFYMDEWLKKGWIEEIQPLEFTRDDLTSFAMYYKDNMNFIKALEENNLIDEWIKEKKYVTQHNE